MPTSGKFGAFDEHTRRSWPWMCEYSSRDVYSQASISDTKGVDLNSCIGRGLKPRYRQAPAAIVGHNEAPFLA
jgi:hypothetical protein